MRPFVGTLQSRLSMISFAVLLRAVERKALTRSKAQNIGLSQQVSRRPEGMQGLSLAPRSHCSARGAFLIGPVSDLRLPCHLASSPAHEHPVAATAVRPGTTSASRGPWASGRPPRPGSAAGLRIVPGYQGLFKYFDCAYLAWGSTSSASWFARSRSDTAVRSSAPQHSLAASITAASPCQAPPPTAPRSRRNRFVNV
jgi:hypothetical protein